MNLCVALALVSLALAGPAVNVDELEKRLPKPKSVHCRFEQHKKSQLFRQTMNSSGELWAERPQHLRVVTEGASGSTFLVNDQEAVIASSSGAEHMNLQSLPKVQYFLATFASLFTGSLGASTTEFSAEVVAHGADSELQLKPKDSKPGIFKRLLLLFHGEPLELAELTLEEDNGDSTQLVLSRCQRDQKLPSDLFAKP